MAISMRSSTAHDKTHVKYPARFRDATHLLYTFARKTLHMNRTFKAWFVRLNWITLVCIFLVTIAGSFVRITGSGMGCPDWPKCFGQYVPPTDAASLPANYKQIYSEKRVKKIEKFSKFLAAIGFKEEAKKIRSDKSLLIEEDFSTRKAWTEWINRLFGVAAGYGVLLVFIGFVFKRKRQNAEPGSVPYKKGKLVLLSGLNLVFMGFQAWFGSIVVASNLVPWTITVHLFMALLIILLQLLIILEVSDSQRVKIKVPASIRWIIIISFLITVVQMFLGTQVRESIDVLTMQGYGRDSWTEKLGMPFYIHRTFSWLVLIMLTVLAWLNYKGPEVRIAYTAFIVLAVELLSGVLLAYADMPGLVQTSHLIFATVLFAVLFVASLRMQKI